MTDSLFMSLMTRMMVGDDAPDSSLPIKNKQTPSILVGYCHSYDYNTPGEQNLRRIRVTYMAKGGSMAVSPLLWRVNMHPGSDPPVPKLGDLVFGFWMDTERTEGVYMGVIQNKEQVENLDQQNDWYEITDEGTITLRAKHIRIHALESLELCSRIKEEGYSEIRMGESGDIAFRDFSGTHTNEEWEERFRALELP